MMLLVGVSSAVRADANRNLEFVVSASNEAANRLLVYDASGALVQSVSTTGAGGVSNNAGGIAARDRQVAVVNFGSQSVSLFELQEDGFALTQVIATLSSPVSVAWGDDHLYVLGTGLVESHKTIGNKVDSSADGSVSLFRADGSAGQVGVLTDRLLITEKSGTVEVVDLRAGVAVGSAREVLIPAGSDTPFGLVTRGSNGYVTIAHSDEVGLVKGDQLIALTGSGNQHSPCWLTIVGPYVYASNSPSHSISRYAVSGKFVVLDEAIVATTSGAPTDIGSSERIVAVLDGGAQTHLTQFRVDDDGNLIQTASSLVNHGANGVAVVKK
jgi:hypothetical protein